MYLSKRNNVYCYSIISLNNLCFHNDINNLVTSFGKVGAMTDMEQNPRKSTSASEPSAMYCLMVNPKYRRAPLPSSPSRSPPTPDPKSNGTGLRETRHSSQNAFRSMDSDMLRAVWKFFG